MFDWVLNTPIVSQLSNGILRKSGPHAKIHYIGQKHLQDKLKVADFKYDNNFSLKLQPKNT